MKILFNVIPRIMYKDTIENTIINIFDKSNDFKIPIDFPRIHKKRFRKAVEESNNNPVLIDLVNYNYEIYFFKGKVILKEKRIQPVYYVADVQDIIEKVYDGKIFINNENVKLKEKDSLYEKGDDSGNSKKIKRKNNESEKRSN